MDQLNNYHPNTKLTTELNPSKFFDAKLTNINGAYKFNFYQKNKTTFTMEKLPLPPKLQKAITEIQSVAIFILQKEYHQPMTKKSL